MSSWVNMDDIPFRMFSCTSKEVGGKVARVLQVNALQRDASVLYAD